MHSLPALPVALTAQPLGVNSAAIALGHYRDLKQGFQNNILVYQIVVSPIINNAFLPPHTYC